MSFRETGFILANCVCVCLHCDTCISCCCIQVKERKYFVVEINVDSIIIASFFKYYSQYNENKIVLVKIVLRCLDNFEIHALFANLPLLSTCYSMRIFVPLENFSFEMVYSMKISDLHVHWTPIELQKFTFQ